MVSSRADLGALAGAFCFHAGSLYSGVQRSRLPCCSCDNVVGRPCRGKTIVFWLAPKWQVFHFRLCITVLLSAGGRWMWCGSRFGNLSQGKPRSDWCESWFIWLTPARPLSRQRWGQCSRFASDVCRSAAKAQTRCTSSHATSHRHRSRSRSQFTAFGV